MKSREWGEKRVRMEEFGFVEQCEVCDMDKPHKYAAWVAAGDGYSRKESL